MNKEIKDILECLEKYGQLTPDAIDDLHYIRDYITNLQESEAYYYGYYISYKQRIDKAIEYINKGKTFDNKEITKAIKYLQNNLLKILKGDE